MTETRTAEEIVGELLPLHGPYDEDTTKRAVNLINATVRYLNYATSSGTALPYPSTAYDLVGILGAAVSKLPQAFSQTGRRLDEFSADPNVVDRNMRYYDEPEEAHGSAAAALIQARVKLDQAGALANQLASLLSEIQNDLSSIGLAYVPEDDEDLD